MNSPQSSANNAPGQRIDPALLPAVIDKIKLVQQGLDLNSTGFAERTHISAATMSRINAEHNPTVSPKTLGKIVDAIDGLSLDWFMDPSATALPKTLQVAPPERHEGWEGSWLKRFRKRNDLTKAQVAEVCATPPSNYSYYEKSQQLQPHVRAKLVKGFTNLLQRPVGELEVFGRTGDIRPLPAAETGSYPIPRIPVPMRAELTPQLIETLRYAPAGQQTRNDGSSSVYYIDSQLLRTGAGVAGQLSDYFALQISPYDRMEPMLRAGYWVLARWLAPVDYPRIVDGLVAVVTRHGDVYVRRVQRNALTAAIPELVLAPYIDGAGAQITIQGGDILLLFHVPKILDGPL